VKGITGSEQAGIGVVDTVVDDVEDDVDVDVTPLPVSNKYTGIGHIFEKHCMQ